MSDILAKYAAARAKYPEDIERIEAEEAQVKKLLDLSEYANLPATQQLLDMCRKQVVDCRRQLATDRSLIGDADAQADLWAIIDARLWVIQMLGKDFEGELRLMEAALEPELSR
jgi:hypothetical protein